MALLVVVLRQRLWGIDLAVSRVTVWSLLTGPWSSGTPGRPVAGAQLLPVSQQVAGLVAAGLVVALGQPLRWWIQGRVDALVYGHGADPVRLLGALSAPTRVPTQGRWTRSWPRCARGCGSAASRCRAWTAR